MLLLESFCTNDKIMTAIKLVKMLIQIMQIMIPIALIVLGSLDLGKAVVSTDEGASKKAQKKFINRCIAAVLVFLSAFIVRFSMGFVGNTQWQECWETTSSATNITCKYGTSGAVTITSKNDKITYSTKLCTRNEGLSDSDFSSGCPDEIYYQTVNAGTDTLCIFTADKSFKNQPYYNALQYQK